VLGLLSAIVRISDVRQKAVVIFQPLHLFFAVVVFVLLFDLEGLVETKPSVLVLELDDTTVFGLGRVLVRARRGPPPNVIF
jgi:hypothetical protein